MVYLRYTPVKLFEVGLQWDRRDVKLLLMSLIYKRDISSPKTVTCGTPDITLMNSDDSSSTTTYCVCCKSQELIHS